MSKKYLVSFGYYSKFIFDTREEAMRFYMAATEGTPLTEVYMAERAEKYEKVRYVRAAEIDVSLATVDPEAVAAHMTESEFQERAKKQPTDIDGDVSLIAAPPVAIAHDPVVDTDPF